MKMLVRRIEEMERCHKQVLKRVEKVEKALHKFRSDEKVDDLKLSLDVFLMYMRNAVNSHRKSEEDVLFPYLRSIDYPKENINDLMNDHEEIHKSTGLLDLLKEMNYDNKEYVDSNVSGLLQTLRDHIEREDEMLRVTKEKLRSEEKIRLKD